MCPVAATLQNTKILDTGENISCLYLLTFTGNYAGGGYAVNGLNKFREIKRLRFEREGNMDDDGNFYRMHSVDNSDDTDPEFYISVYEIASGGVDIDEKTGGHAHASSIYVEVEGHPLKGVECDPW